VVCIIARTCVFAVPPVMLTKMSRVEGVVDGPITVSCEASGTPPPKYEFHKVRDLHACRTACTRFIDAC